MTTTEQQEKPSLWQRITGGVKRFFSHAIGYIPRGAVFTGVIFAASSVLESQTGIGIGINEMNTTTLMNHYAGHLAFGSLISGSLGAAFGDCTKCPTQQGAKATSASGNPLLNETEVGLGQKIVKELGSQATDLAKSSFAEAAFPGSGLPAHLANAAARFTQPSSSR